jgi:hypothetical protein
MLVEYSSLFDVIGNPVTFTISRKIIISSRSFIVIKVRIVAFSLKLFAAVVMNGFHEIVTKFLGNTSNTTFYHWAKVKVED